MNKEGSFVRWHTISMNQLGFTSNLIFTINITILGFLINKIIEKDFYLLCEGKALYTIGLIILTLCFVVGIVINLTRLYDFRLTAKTARIREENESSSELKDLRKTTKCLGKSTWVIFKIQVTLFGLGLISIVLSIMFMFSEKLF